MRLLLDTDVWLWLVSEPERLPGQVRDALADQTSELLLSGASAWEIAIKVSLGKLLLDEPLGPFLARHLAASMVRPLDVTVAHAVAVADLPPLHRDPFDRLLVAQARTDRLTLVTLDPLARRYDVPVLPT